MKKVKMFVATIAMVFSLQMAFAQPEGGPEDGKKREKIEALKRAFITEKLELTVAEAEKFWPLYNAHDKQKSEVRKSIREKYKSLEEAGKTEKDATSAIDFITQKRKEEADIEAKFFKDCLPVLGVDKTIKLASSEREFQHEVMRSIKEKREDKDHKGPKGDKGPKGPK